MLRLSKDLYHKRLSSGSHLSMLRLSRDPRHKRPSSGSHLSMLRLSRDLCRKRPSSGSHLSMLRLSRDLWPKRPSSGSHLSMLRLSRDLFLKLQPQMRHRSACHQNRPIRNKTSLSHSPTLFKQQKCPKDYDFEYIHHFLKQPLSDNLCSFHKADANIASAFLLPHLTHSVLSVISPMPHIMN